MVKIEPFSVELVREYFIDHTIFFICLDLAAFSKVPCLFLVDHQNYGPVRNVDGRNTKPVEVILRSYVLSPLFGCDYCSQSINSNLQNPMVETTSALC